MKNVGNLDFSICRCESVPAPAIMRFFLLKLNFPRSRIFHSIEGNKSESSFDKQQQITQDKLYRY